MQFSRKMVSRHAQKTTFCQLQSTIVHQSTWVAGGLSPTRSILVNFPNGKGLAKRGRNQKLDGIALSHPYQGLHSGLYPASSFPCIPCLFKIFKKQIFGHTLLFPSNISKIQEDCFWLGILPGSLPCRRQVPCCTNPNLYYFILSQRSHSENY